MRIAYLSLTGNVRKFVKEGLGISDGIEIPYANPLIEINEDFILIMPSYDDEITELMSEFVEHANNLNHLVAIAGSGNTYFTESGYCYNAVEISEKYQKPLIFKFEFSGTEEDIVNFKKEMHKIEITRVK